MFNHKSAISGDAGESIEPKMVMTPVRLDHDQAETWDVPPEERLKLNDQLNVYRNPQDLLVKVSDSAFNLTINSQIYVCKNIYIYVYLGFERSPDENPSCLFRLHHDGSAAITGPGILPGSLTRQGRLPGMAGPWAAAIYSWLVVDLPLCKIWKSVGMMTFPIYGKIKNAPNHQPV